MAESLIRPPLSGKVGFRPYSAEEATAKLARIGREASRLKRMYADVVSMSVAVGGSSEPHTGGDMPDPTLNAAVDPHSRYMRDLAPELSALIAVAELAIVRCTKKIRDSDRMQGEQVGESGVWDTGRAERAEARAGARRHSGAWRA